jgi:hypothetical protein
MADPPRYTRIPGQPPPLPRPTLVPQGPFPPEPFVDLTIEPAPDTVRTRRDEDLPAPLPLTEETARGLRRELVLLREALPTLPTIPVRPTTVAPASGDPASLRTATKKQIAAVVGKYSWWSTASFLLTILGAYVAQRWPDYATLSRWLLGWLP